MTMTMPRPSTVFIAPEKGWEKPQDTKSVSPTQTRAGMNLNQFLRTCHNLPARTTALGYCEDGTPLTFNLEEPSPVALLINGGTNTGKTHLLKILLHAAMATSSPYDIKFAVLTRRVEEWNDIDRLGGSSGHSLGIFPTYEDSAGEMIEHMATRIEQRLNGRHTGAATLLVIDELDQMTHMNFDTVTSLVWSIRFGSRAQIWPVATLDPLTMDANHELLRNFRTRVYPWSEEMEPLRIKPGKEIATQVLPSGPQFAVQLNRQWLRFFLPTYP